MRIEARDIIREFTDPVRRLVYPSITFASGEFLAVVGPSGVGKSTLLGILGGLQQPSSGIVVTFPAHRDVRNLVSWISQQSNALPARSVIDNVALGALASGHDGRAAEAIAGDALARVGLRGADRQLCRTLSGGELQRVTVARAIASDRPFIFADEPTGHLDRSNTTLVIDALEEASRVGKGVIVVTHDLTIAGRAVRVIEL